MTGHIYMDNLVLSHFELTCFSMGKPCLSISMWCISTLQKRYSEACPPRCKSLRNNWLIPRHGLHHSLFSQRPSHSFNVMSCVVFFCPGKREELDLNWIEWSYSCILLLPHCWNMSSDDGRTYCLCFCSLCRRATFLPQAQRTSKVP